MLTRHWIFDGQKSQIEGKVIENFEGFVTRNSSIEASCCVKITLCGDLNFFNEEMEIAIDIFAQLEQIWMNRSSIEINFQFQPRFVVRKISFHL